MGFISAGSYGLRHRLLLPALPLSRTGADLLPLPGELCGATYYNRATGAWAHGGRDLRSVVRARGGSAYNPQTGAYARGGSVYGPYGGAGAFSAYNPDHRQLRTRQRGLGRRWWQLAMPASYNARTGVSGTTNQNANAVRTLGFEHGDRPNQTVHTQSQSNARGSAGAPSVRAPGPRAQRCAVRAATAPAR